MKRRNLTALFLFLMTCFLFSSFSQAHVCAFGRVDGLRIHKYNFYDVPYPYSGYGYSVKIDNNWYKLRTNNYVNLGEKHVLENLETIRMSYFFGGNIKLENAHLKDSCLEDKELLFTDVTLLRY